MSSIVYQTNKTTGTVYAYESESYRDPVTKKPKSRRKYIGRVDPDTKRIIPKAQEGKRNRSKSIDSYTVLPDDVLLEMKNQKEQIIKLQQQVDELSRRDKENTDLINKMKQLLADFN